MLLEMEHGFDRAGNILSATMKRLGIMAKSQNGRWMWYLILFVLAVFLYIYAFRFKR